jgi:hypothetical protein
MDDQVARGWLIYELTDSAFQLGLVRGPGHPILLLSPLAGSTADRYSRKMQVLVAQLVDGLLYALIAVLILAGEIQPWHVCDRLRHVHCLDISATLQGRHDR